MARVHQQRFAQPLACLSRAAELQQDDGAHHPCLRERGIDPDRLGELRRRLFQPSGQPKGFRQPEPRLQVVRPQLDRRRVALRRLRVPAAHAQDHTDSELRLLEIGRDAQRRLELGDGAFGVAPHHQGGPQPVPQGGVVRRLGQPLPEDRRRRVEAARVHGPHSADLVGESAPQQTVVRLHQRVRGRRHALASTLQVRLGGVQIAQRAVRHPQVVVQTPRGRLQREGALQVTDRPARVPRGEGSPPGAGQRRCRGGIDRQRALERHRRLGGTPTVELHPPEPYQRREVRGFEGERPGKELGRPLAIPPLAIQVREIVGPAHDAGRQSMRIQVRNLRPLAVVGGHQDETELAVGISQHRRGRVGTVGSTRHRSVTLAHLRLHRRGQTRHVRPTHRLRSRPIERARDRQGGTARIGRPAATCRGESDHGQKPARHRGVPREARRPSRRPRRCRPPAPRRTHRGSPSPCTSVL